MLCSAIVQSTILHSLTNTKKQRTGKPANKEQQQAICEKSLQLIWHKWNFGAKHSRRRATFSKLLSTKGSTSA
uniref:Uncharacterized protein n=1 Tax=Anguilla anguilla TaxID=7936 RepID=A0A0E9V1R8_ANGAN